MSLPTPSFAFSRQRRYYDRKMPAARMIRERIHDGSVDVYGVRWDAVDASDMSDILTEFDNSRGGAGTVSLTLPTAMGGATVQARFKGPLNIRRINSYLWEVEADMEVGRA